MQTQEPEPNLQRRWNKPLQTPEPKLQRGWPTTIQMPALHEDEQHQRHNTLPEPIQTIEELKDQKHLPKRGKGIWQVIAVAGFVLVLVVSTAWWGVAAVMP